MIPDETTSLLLCSPTLSSSSLKRTLSELLKKGKVDKGDPTLKLNPFLHKGLARVGSRLRHAPMPFENRHPLLLQADDKITRWFVRESHLITMHGEPQLTLATLRLKYCIVKGWYAESFYQKNVPHAVTDQDGQTRKWWVTCQTKEDIPLSHFRWAGWIMQAQ